MRVLVLGAGMAGVACAWYLWRDGHEVTVLERHSGAALETTFANGGQLSYSYVAPLASPSVIPKIPPWLLRRDAPLRFRPALDPEQWRWCLAFLAACNHRAAERTTERLLRLAFYSRDLMRELRDAHDVHFDYAASGKLVVHRERESFASARRLMEFQRRFGCEQFALAPAEAVAVEPALAHLVARMTGAIHTPSEDAGDSYKFVNELKRLTSTGAHPVTYRFGVEARRLLPWRGRLMGVETTMGVFEADAYVVSLGNGAAAMARSVGIRLPVYPLKGYSLTLPIVNDEAAPKVSVTDYQRRVVYARLGSELRVAGMADLAGHRADIDVERIEQLAAEARSAFPEASDFSTIRPWSGLRPATPGGAPVLGPTPYANLWLNTGHGALGFTLGLATGRIVADLIAGRESAVPLDGFTL